MIATRAACLLAALGFAAAAVAVTSGQDQQPVFRARSDAVTIQVSVKSGNKPVAGLSAADFALRDNGVPQTVTSVSAEQVPVDLTVLLDLSASVDGRQLERLKTAVRDTARLLHADDRIRLVAVTHVLHETFDLRSNSGALPLDALAAAGATSLYDGLGAAMMRPSEPGRRQLVVAFTDGRDSTSILDEPAVKDLARLTDVVVNIVVPTFTTGPPMPRDDPRMTWMASQPWAKGEPFPPVLTDLVEPSTGQVLLLELDQSISRAFKKLLDDFRTTYVLEYLPQGVAPPGWHDVVVKLTRPGSYEIRSRRGYQG